MEFKKLDYRTDEWVKIILKESKIPCEELLGYIVIRKRDWKKATPRRRANAEADLLCHHVVIREVPNHPYMIATWWEYHKF